MIVKKIIILSILFTQSLSAPSGCIESCSTYHKVHSYRTQQISNNPDDHASLVQTNSNAQNINYLNLNYDKPGNWTEQNEYRTDGGRGKVYEEQGQYVDGSSHVRYFKKNYTSSYSSTHVSNPDLPQQERLTNQAKYNFIHAANSQGLYEQSRNRDSYRQEQTYNNLHSNQLQQSYKQRESHNGRLENFEGLSEGSQVSQHGISTDDSEILQGQNQYIETRPGNWSNVNAYKTDGGHGHVLEVEGQYVTGPKKVRYYRKNYTSHYSTSSNPEHQIISKNINNLQNEMHSVNQELKNFEEDILQQSHSKHVASSNTLNTGTINIIPDNLQSNLENYNLQVTESTNYGQRLQNEHISPTHITHHAPTNHLTDRQIINNINEGVSYKNPNNIYTAHEENIHHQKQETYTSQYHTNVSPNHIHIPISENNGYQRYVDNIQIIGNQNRDENYQKEHINMHQSQATQNYVSNGNLQHNALNGRVGIYPSTAGQIRHYENHWNAMEQRREIDTSNPYKRGEYSLYPINQQYNAEVGQSTSTNFRPHYKTNLERLVTGEADIGHGAQHVDCTGEMQQIQYGYNRKYKRNTDSQKYNKLLQQHEQIQTTQKQVQPHYQPAILTYSDYEHPSTLQQYQHLGQQNEDLTQQNEDLTQQSSGFDDLTQQTSGHLEFGQHTQQSQKPGRYTSHSQQGEDLTQQNEDLTQQTGGFDDLTQQTSGHLEFGQHTQQSQKPGRYTSHSQQGEDLTQQNEDLTQQTGGFDDPNHPLMKHLVSGGHVQRAQNPAIFNSYNQKWEHSNQQMNGLDLASQSGNSYVHPSSSGTLEQLDMNHNKPLQVLTPAPKPQWRPRYQTPSQRATPSVSYTSSNNYNQINISDETTREPTRGDQPNLQVENEPNNLSQQGGFNQPNIQQDNTQVNQQHNINKKVGFTKGGHRFRHIYRQSFPYSSHISNVNYVNRSPQTSQIDNNGSQFPVNQNVDDFQEINQKHVPKETENQNNNADVKLEPRILVAYGGGPYDSNHTDDIFNRAVLNPSATLPPSIDGTDPWNIIEKPKEVVPLSTTTTISPAITEIVETEAPPNFWGRIAHKLTNTFDKAKEKAKDLFG